MLNALHSSLVSVRSKRPCSIEALVVLPDHLHCVWRLIGDDADFSTRWRLIKGGTTRLLGYNPWQRRLWEHGIRDENDMNNHIDYIHFNPVKHGLVSRATDWPHSSIHRYMASGLDENWDTFYKPINGVGKE